MPFPLGTRPAATHRPSLRAPIRQKRQRRRLRVVERGGAERAAFKVHGTDRLRVVDASVFPRVPGLFIVCAVYMVGERAADRIIAQARA